MLRTEVKKKTAMIKSVGLIQPSVNDRGYGNNNRNGGDDLTKRATKKENKITESSKVPYRISNTKSKRNSDSPANTNLDQYRNHHPIAAKGYSSKNHLSKSCTALHNYEDGIEITSSEDNTIRIQIKYDESVPTSAYSFTKLPTNVCYDNKGITRLSTDFAENFGFNEKPIDVPEEFEKNSRLRVREQGKVHGRKKVATSVRQLHPLKEFLQEDWIKIDDDFDEELLQSSLFDRKHVIRHQLRDRPSRRHSSSELNMGVNCSKKLQRIGKHEVAPLQDVAKQVTVQPNPTNLRKSTNPFDDDYDDEVDTQPNVRQRISNRVSEPIQTCWSSKNASPDVFSPQLCTPRPLSSSIDTNSIMFRSTEIYSARKRQIVRDHLNQSAIPKATRTSELNHERVVHPSENGNKNFQHFYHRMGGSFQNLVRVTKNVKGKSASESNLSKLSTNNAKNKSTKRLNSENVDYCPSVFFNRFVAIRERKNAEAEKNFTLKKIKTYLNGNLFNRKRNDHSTNRTIQDLDGRFFEKFGSLLRQKSEYAEEKIVATPLAPLPSDECPAPDSDCQLRTIEEGENDSGTETLQDTDSEHDEQDQTKKNEEIFTDLVGLNIEELYEEVLYEIIHNVGCEVENETCPNALFQYLQDAFKIVNGRHDEIMRSAESKEAPEIRLNVEVIEAKELQSKDPNGSSDPFVTLYIASSPTHRYNTSVKSCTLNPMWEEHFSLPITEAPNDENLVVEVWDFDPAETVSEKMTKFFDVKGVKGFKKLMKEIAVTASTGKDDNELIGRCNIPLRTIPASGLVMWFSLDKKNKVKRQGLIKIRLAFSAEKNNRVAVQEHKNLLRILLMHELDSSKVAPYWWSGKFSNQGEAVIAQHSAQSGLSAMDCAFAQWSVYTAIHNDHPLAFNLFESLIDKLIRPIQSASISEDDIKNFWDGTTKLLPSCFSVIRKLRKKTATDKNCVKTLTDVLSILSKVAMLEPPEGTDLFPKSIYGWVTRPNDGPSWDIHGTLQDAVTSGAKDWFAHISDNNCTGSNDSDEDKLQNVIKIIQLVRSDLQRAIEYYDKLFQQKMHFPYARTCYVYYEEKLSEYIEPVIHDVCKNLKRLSLPDDRYQPLPEHEEVNMGTTLFELYLVLKRFAVLWTALSPISTDFKINQYHQWFTPGVTHWLDISVYKALIRIEKAIELDQLIPVDETVKYSSSAVDTLAIFYQIKIFWQQLDWPDAEGSYMFVGKIVDDICRCCVFYADRMSTRVEGLGDVQNVYESNKFEVTREWCLAINNIDYIRQSLSPFVKELRVDEIIAKLSDYRSSMEAERCSDTLKNVVANALDTETNKIVELIEVVARKMSPPMRRFLAEGAELLHQDSNSMDRIMMYLEDSLQTLNAELNEVNFERILDAIWTELAFILKELVQNNIDRRRPPLFFANLRDTLQMMVKSFKGTQGNKDRASSDKETLEEIFNLLKLHGYETSDLIHQYYLERAKQQDNTPDNQYGQLTVRCWFEDNNLLIDVMNARNLVPMDSNGSCDPFVRIHLLPEEKFGNVTTKIKTKAQDKTLFPLFDEKFSITLTPDQKSMHNAVVMFSLKDKDLFGYANQYIAECYLIFQNIPDDSSDQIHLKLSRPTCTSSECIQALEYRQGDKQAKDFMKKLKQKMNAPK